MSHRYKLNETVVKSGNKIAFLVYGIDAVDENGNIAQSFTNIFFQRSKAEDFVNLCNECELCLIHLANVVEDALYEQSVSFAKPCYWG